jgi:hypothetical protein
MYPFEAWQLTRNYDAYYRRNLGMIFQHNNKMLAQF